MPPGEDTTTGDGGEGDRRGIPALTQWHDRRPCTYIQELRDHRIVAGSERRRVKGHGRVGRPVVYVQLIETIYHKPSGEIFFHLGHN